MTGGKNIYQRVKLLTRRSRKLCWRPSNFARCKKKKDEEKKKREGENEDTGTLIHDAAPNYMRVHSNA